MNKMKKSILFCLIFILLVTASVTSYADDSTSDMSEEHEAILIYDMSLEGSTLDTGSGQTLVITDESGAGYVVDGVDGHSLSSNQPVLKSTGYKDAKYLEFAYLPSEDKTGDGEITSQDLQGTDRSLKVNFKKDSKNGIDKGGEVADLDELTIELWARVGQRVTVFGNIFALGPNGGADGTSAFSGQFNGGTGYTDIGADMTFYIDRAFNQRNGTTYVTLGTDKYKSEWVHIVLTKEWIEASPVEFDEDGKLEKPASGQWRVNAYVNGQALSGGDLGALLPKGAPKTEKLSYTGGFRLGKEATSYVYTEDDKNANVYFADTLSIGSNLAGKGFPCDIGDFKIYKGIRGANEIAETYADERTNYMSVPDVTDETIDNLEKLGRTDLEFDVQFDDEVDSKTVESIYIEDETGKKVAAKFKEYTDCKATFVLEDFLRYDTNYYLCLPGVKALDGGLVARRRIKFVSAPKSDIAVTEVLINSTDKENVNFNAFSDDEAKISLNVKNTNLDGSPIKIGMMMMIYKDGRAVQLIKKPTMEIASGATGVLTLSTKDYDSGIILGEGYKIRSFAWSEGEKGFIGFSNPIELICAE